MTDSDARPLSPPSPQSSPSPREAGTADLRAIDRDNLGGAIYSSLCDGLIKGHFQPNDRVRIRELAERLGTSVTPVRDAVLRLVQDGALVMRSSRDIRVPILSTATYLEIRTIRTNLEGLAAATAAEQVDDAALAELRANIAENEAVVDAGDAARATELNQIFHFRLTEIAGMPVLKGILQRLWLQMGPLIAEMYLSAGREVIENHRATVEALARHDSEAAARAIRADILHGGAPILERVRRYEREAQTAARAVRPAVTDDARGG